MFDLDVVNAFSKGTVIILKSYFNSKVGKGDVLGIDGGHGADVPMENELAPAAVNGDVLHVLR